MKESYSRLCATASLPNDGNNSLDCIPLFKTIAD